MKHLVVASFFLTVLASFANAKTLQNYYEKLASTGADFTVFGTVCEQQAVIELQDEYPSVFYTIVTGIEYFNEQRTLGELDVVVFENGTGEAILVAEVKCWRNSRGGRRKAEQQIARFQNALEDHSIHRMQRYHEQYDTLQFDQNPTFQIVGQKGTVAKAHYDWELELDLDDLHTLHEMLQGSRNHWDYASDYSHSNEAAYAY